MFGNPYYAPYQYPNYYAQNDGFKPQMQQPIQNNAQPQQMLQTANFQPKNDMIWVLNESEAAAYPVAPNCSVVLWHKSEPILYIKSANMQGVPSMRIIDYKERTENVQNSPVINKNDLDGKFVTIEQFDNLKADFDGLKAEYNKIIELQNTKIEEKPKNQSKKDKNNE